MTDKIKVLVVEDDLNWKYIFKNLIENKTSDLFDYIYAETLSSAIENVKSEKLDIVLLDLMLPDSITINTIQVMVREANHLPIVVLSTLDDESLMQKAFDSGIQDYLVKNHYDVNLFIHIFARYDTLILCSQIYNPLLGNDLILIG